LDGKVRIQGATSRQRSIKDAIEEIAAQSPAEGHPGWLFRRRISRADRSEVLLKVIYDSDPRWFAAFVVMLALSAGIASLGLSQNSAATVIGAMVIAPLGDPMAALGGAIALAWPRETLRMLLVTAAGAALVVAVAFLIGLLLPTSTPDAQILARTSPDLRDLGVALMAGAAGAYAKTRNKLASTLTGVAIAVALVPPLATVGLMLEEHRFALARGAAVLFAANLIGIVLAATLVLLLTGYAPLPRLRRAGLPLWPLRRLSW
jgi:uncharacterized hydrophobic protein (TIGR00271 family)